MEHKMLNLRVIENLAKMIFVSVKKAQKEDISYSEIYSNSTLQSGKNEFLFFLKPEITVESNSIQLDRIINLVLEKIEIFRFNIHNVKILPASYMKKHKIAEQHYGVINKISTNAQLYISEIAKEKFKYLYGINMEEIEFMGGHQFLAKFEDESPFSLNELWEKKEDAWKSKYQNLPMKELEALNKVNNVKLAGGTYCKIIIKRNLPYAVLNGFNPVQIEHFTMTGRSIVIMTLSNDLSWKGARENFIGKTNPVLANKGSIRRELLDNKISLGLNEVTQGINGVHLSAGPVEALIELKRFNSNLDEGVIMDFSDFSFGKLLLNNFRGKLQEIVDNVNVVDSGKPTSIFDLTEEKDSQESISILNAYF